MNDCPQATFYGAANTGAVADRNDVDLSYIEGFATMPKPTQVFDAKQVLAVGTVVAELWSDGLDCSGKRSGSPQVLVQESLINFPKEHQMRKFFTKVAIAAASAAGMTGAANAYVTVSVSDGTTTLSCSSNNFVGCDSRFTFIDTETLRFSTGNDTNVSNLFAGYVINSTIGTSNSPGEATIATINTTNTTIINKTAVAGGMLTLTVDAFDFTLPSSLGKTLVGQAAFTAPVNSAGLDSVTGIFGADGLNGTSFASTTGCTATLSASANNCSASQINWLDANGGTFSLRDRLQFTLQRDTRVTGSSSVTVGIPEPTTTALVGAALLALGATTRRRNAKKA